MARGGYRTGAGRPKGAKSGTRKDPKDKIPNDIKDEAAAVNLDPLTYMLKVMNDPKESDKARKDRMAIAAAPFVHARKGEGVGKKEDLEGRAKAAGSGKFKASSPPVLTVVGKK